ncbi:MAG: tRNA (adenosine(37)-N6)-threonylcarbamoyltransferase complex ATPase subunit type 1 TsaE [Clostridia bacterium]|nr:tRNA (adenosine(37)-N6)-threonylcarbamoyltransferase complex ATPase subunit type 1 TsaE [Clostridia bacterium]
MYSYQSFSPEETLALAKKLGAKLQGGEILVLEGDLGAGKTHFVKGLAEGLGVKESVTSPTFTLLHLYEGRLPLAHFDVYRLSSSEAFEELGYEEYFSDSGVTAIEWGDLISPYLPSEYLQIKITHLYQEELGEGRLITFSPHGELIQALIKELAIDACFRN